MTTWRTWATLLLPLPPSDIQLTDDQAAEFLSDEKGYIKASIICLKGFPKPKHITETVKGRRWNLKKVSDWLNESP